jgi:proteasome lid subunit RPN8/RPN11
MRLNLRPNHISKLKRELMRAGSHEIGGVLGGEHVGPDEFDLVDFSVQRSGGNRSCFVRRPRQHRRFLRRFFDRTGHSYERFNYLGEWHSHPSFEARPSAVDIVQMMNIVNDPDQSAMFAVLLIVRLDAPGELELSATFFRRSTDAEPADVAVLGAIAPKIGLGSRPNMIARTLLTWIAGWRD